MNGYNYNENMNIDITSYLVEKSKEMMKKTRKEVERSQMPSEKSVALSDIIKKLNENIDNILLIDNTKIVQSLNGIMDNNELVKMLNELDAIRVIAEGRKNGVPFEYNSDELGTIKLLIKNVSIAKEKADLETKNNVDSSLVHIYDKYTELYDSLRAGEEGYKYIEPELIADLIKGESKDIFYLAFEYVINLNKKIDMNIRRKQVNFGDTNNIENQGRKRVEPIDEDLLRETFKKYGYDYDFKLPYDPEVDGPKDPNKGIKNLKEWLRTRKLDDIVKIFEIVTKNPEYMLFKNKINNSDTVSEKKNTYELFLRILGDADVDVLGEYMIKECKERNISMSDLLEIPGIFKHSSNGKRRSHNTTASSDNTEFITGTWDYYKQNTNTLLTLGKELGFEHFYDYFMERCPEVIVTNSKRFEKNIFLTKLYGLPFINEAGTKLAAGAALKSCNFARNMDFFIERNLYNYVVNNRSCLWSLSELETLAYREMKGLIEISFNGGITDGLNYKFKKIPSDFNEVITSSSKIDLINRIPDKYKVSIYGNFSSSQLNIDEDNSEEEQMKQNEKELYELRAMLYYNDKYLTELEQFSYNDGSTISKIAYNINGILVSKIKVYRIWMKLMEVYDPKDDVSMDDLILYALTYNSYYTEEEFLNIKNAVANRGAM